MPRTCTVCTHPEREAIDRTLVGGVAFPGLAAKYRVSEDALGRHRANHLPITLAQAHEAEETARADDLLDQLVGLQVRTLALLTKAERTNKLMVALMAIREARNNLELLAKLTQQLDSRPTLNLLVAPEWLAVRAALLQALAPYPEARTAVAARLVELEAG